MRWRWRRGCSLPPPPPLLAVFQSLQERSARPPAPGLGGRASLRPGSDPPLAPLAFCLEKSARVPLSSVLSSSSASRRLAVVVVVAAVVVVALPAAPLGASPPSAPLGASLSSSRRPSFGRLASSFNWAGRTWW